MSGRLLDETAHALLRALGDVLRDVRKARGLLQTQIAARAGVSAARVGEAERAGTNMSLGGIIMIARALGVPLSAVLRRAEVAMLDEHGVNEIRARIVEAIRKVAPADLDLVALIVARLAVKR